MSVSIKFDTSKLNEQIRRAQQELQKEMPLLIKDETRLLLKQAIAFTPPKNQKQGKGAIYKDVFQSNIGRSGGLFVRILDYMKPEMHPHGVSLFTAKNGFTFGVDPSKYIPNASVEQMRSIHNSARSGSRGRPKSPSPALRKIGANYVEINRYAVSERSANRYFRYLSKHVGRMKAGWLPAYAAVGGEAVGWVRKHAPDARGILVNNLSRLIFPQITIGNKSLGISFLRNAFQSAINVRAKSLKRKINHELKGRKLQNTFKY